MAPPSLTWKQVLARQYRNDPDLRGALNAGSVGTSAGFLSAVIWPIITRSYFAMFGIVLLSTVFFARKRSMNPLIVLQATVLGLVFGTCLFYILSTYNTVVLLFSLYISSMAVFHFTEFVFTAISNRRGLQADSFLLNHSVAYWIAACSSWTEFALEAYFAPSTKTLWLGLVGVLMCVLGEVMRKTAMLHAGNGFTHRLALSKKPDHRLCTTGIYAWVRHPGYSGWFLWSVGTQVILCNPFCFVAYAVVSWRFFEERIREEERDLINFFGAQYVDYQDQVWGGVPFVEGYRVAT